jgi:hypothetical protein
MMFIDPSSLISSTAGAAGASVNRPDDLKKRPGQADQVQLREEYARVLRRALQMEDTHPEMVRQLRESLESGRFDTIEAAIEAARMMIQYGI